MINDKIFRQFKSQPFQQSFEGSSQFEDFRDNLMIGQIIKCGKEILGSIGISIEDQNQQTTDNEQRRPRSSKQSSIPRSQKSKYIYEFDYGKDPQKSAKSIRDQTDSPAEEISFTLSNQDNKYEDFIQEKYQQIMDKERRVSWKGKLVEQNIPRKHNQSLKQITNETADKSAKPIKSTLPTKTYERSSQSKPLLNNLSTSKNPLNNQYVPKRLQSPTKTKPDNQTLSNKKEFKTPQKMTKMSKKTLKIPLSEQITKNVYGKLKTQVQDQNFLQDYEQKQKRSQGESQVKWKSFLLRSQKWTDERKHHLIEMQMNEKYSAPQKSRSKQKNNTEHEYSSYLSLKVRRQPAQQGQMEYTVHNNRIHPENTLKTNNNSPQKRESSVQNCINKLKTQTQLLKVKLLSPLKKQLENNTEIEHYKQLNETQSRKSIKRYRQNYEEKPFAKTNSTLINVQNIYGKCIGQKSHN